MKEADRNYSYAANQGTVVANWKNYDGMISEANNISTSAENAYRYIKKLIDFKESHTGLEDVQIEIEIMAYCFRQHKKMESCINSSCWRKVQRKRKEKDLQKTFKKVIDK